MPRPFSLLCSRVASVAPTGCFDVDPGWPEPIIWLAESAFEAIRANKATLKQGETDPTPLGPVHLLQRALRHWGCAEKKVSADLLPAFGVDGVFGPETKAAVVAFQSESRDKDGIPLVTDGIVGHRTLGALDRLIIPPPSPPSLVIAVTVDVVIFPDGHPAGILPTVLHEANYVFGKVGIRFVLGTVWGPERTGPLACEIFEANRKGREAPGACPSLVELASLLTGNTKEMGRLTALRPGSPQRVTVYHVGSFPKGSPTPWGATFTPNCHRLPFSVLIANSTSADPRDIWWHELGHVLLHTGVNDPVDGKYDDHSHGFMSLDAGLSKASLPIPNAVARRMRDTALLDLS